MISATGARDRPAIAAFVAGMGGELLDCARFASATSCALYTLTVRLPGAGVTRLVLKNLSPAALLPDAARTRPQFCYEAEREIAVYRDILAATDLDTARFFGACADPQADDCWLLVERVEGVELWQVEDRAVWAEVARWLGRLHVREDLRLAAAGLPVRILDRDWYVCWRDRAAAAVGPRLERVLRGYDRVLDQLCALPATFIHGECYAANVLIGPSGRICPIDWETAGIGPGLMDLAALVAGWDERVTQDLVTAYRTAGGDPGLSATAFAVALDCCRLQLCLQWLGWSPGWQPPLEHAQDWLAQASDLADRLDL